MCWYVKRNQEHMRAGVHMCTHVHTHSGMTRVTWLRAMSLWEREETAASHLGTAEEAARRRRDTELGPHRAQS